jgi:integrase/recombinase XerD
MDLTKTLLDFRKELSNRNYSKNTQTHYLGYARRYLLYSMKNPDVPPAERLIDFLFDTLPEGESRFGAFSAIQALYRAVFDKEPPYYLRHRKKPKRLPHVLSREEINDILEAIPNPKHRMMVATLYASGLRVGELPNLRVADVDLQSAKLRVNAAKGKKDRFTLLSKKLDYAALLVGREGSQYLFQTRFGQRYSVRSIQCILEKAVKTCGIKKKVTCHALRHSFATHLFRSGVSIGRIREYLGHSTIDTTLIYTHLELLADSDIVSPF